MSEAVTRPAGALPRRALWWGIPMLVMVGIVCGAPVPWGTEYVHLVAPYRMFHPDFLAGDWMFSVVRRPHLVFDTMAGLAMRVAGLEAVGWIGRVVTWTALMVGFLRIGARFRLPPWMASVAVVIWLASGQSLVGDEWMVGEFEAKAVSYAFLVFGLDALLGGLDRRGAALLGLCFSFHPAVGFSAAFAVAVSLILLRRPRRELAMASVWFGLFALPGILATILISGGTVAAGRDTWHFVVTVAMPFHLDPLTFSRPSLLVLAVLFGFIVLHAVRFADDRAVRFSAFFLGALGVVFLGGVGVRLIGWFELLQIFPFRLFPLLTLVLFYYHLAHAFHHRGPSRLTVPAALAALAALLMQQSPLDRGVREARRRWTAWTPDATQQAFVWVRDHTPRDATVIADPLRKDSYYWTERAQVGMLRAIAYGRLPEWRARSETMLGGEVRLARMTRGEISQRFAGLTTMDIETIVRRYGGDYLVSSGDYPYPVLYRVGDVRVFQLPQAPLPGSSAGIAARD